MGTHPPPEVPAVAGDNTQMGLSFDHQA